MTNINTYTLLSIVKKPDLETTHEIFDKIITKYLDGKKEEVLKVGTPTQIPNQYMFALEVPVENAIKIVKELTYEGVSVVKNEAFIKIAVNEAMYELQSEQTNKIQQLKKEESLKQKLRKKGDYSVEELVYLKDWLLMLDIALIQSHDNIEISRRIKELLPEVLDEAIENELGRDTKSLEIARGCVERLLLIAENETLKRMHLLNIMKKAGEAVIDICLHHPKEMITELLFLANSRITVPIINVKAFLSFYEVVKKDCEKYDDEISEAARHLNTRALDTIYFSAVNLKPDEKKLFNSGIEFFKQKRIEL